MQKPFALFLFALIVVLLTSCASTPRFEDNDIPESVEITRAGGIISIIPRGWDGKNGFIFYPGGLVDPEAYLPMASVTAVRAKIAVFIPKMPMNLALFGKNRASEIREENDKVEKWYIGGHSLGGVMASSHLYENDLFAGLILMASYPMESASLHDFELPVLALFGERDGLVLGEERDSAVDLLPPGTIHIVMEGANHSQFGSYGLQRGDNPAVLSTEDQQQMMADHIDDFING